MMLAKRFLLLVALFLSSTTAAPYNTYESVAPLVSSDSAQVIPDSYIVVFKKHVDEIQVKYHHSCVHNYVAEEKKNSFKEGLIRRFGIWHQT